MGLDARGILPDVQTAYNTLMEAVHQRIFFQKCAAAGLVPRTPEEAVTMLQTAGKLRLLEQSLMHKAAAASMEAGFNPYQAADQLVDSLASATHPEWRQKVAESAAQAEDAAHWEAATLLCADPTLYNSVLALKAAEAAEIQSAFGS